MRKLLIICLLICACDLQAQIWTNIINTNPKSWAHFVASTVDSTNNVLYLGGQFYFNNPFPSRSLIKYNGTTFDTLQSGLDDYQQFSNTQVSTLVMFQNKLYVGGNFKKTGKFWCKNLGRWNGTTWDTINFNPNNTVLNMQVYNNELYVSGDFNNIGGINCNGLAKFDGINWYSLNNPYRCITAMAHFNSKLYISSMVSANSSCANLMYYDGTNWYPWVGVLGDGAKSIEGISVIDSLLFVYGRFNSIAGTNCKGIAAYNGSKWFNFGTGLSNSTWETIYDVKKINSDIYITGHYNTIEGISTGTIGTINQSYTNIVKFDGQKICTISPPFGYDIHGLVKYNNDIYAHGSFMKIGNDSVWGLVKWNGGNNIISCSNNISINQSIIGLNEAQLSNNLNIYPNPVKENIVLEFLDIEVNNASIELYNSIGQKINEIKNINKKVLIDLSQYSNGIYFLKVNNNFSQKTFKIIKE